MFGHHCSKRMKTFKSNPSLEASASHFVLGGNTISSAKERSVGKCVALDTLVHTDKGIFRVGDFLPKTRKPDTYYDIPTIKVLTDEGFKDSSQIYYSGKKPVVKITTDCGRSITCTPEHRFRTTDKSGKYIWIKASKIKPGREIYTKLGDDFAPQGKVKYPLGLKKTEQIDCLACITGLFIKEGTVIGDKIILAAEALETVKFLIQGIGIKAKIEEPTKKLDATTITHVELAKWLHKNAEKGIPDFFMENGKKAWVAQLLLSLSTPCPIGFTFCYNNLILLIQIDNLMLRFGANGRILTKEHSTNGKNSLAYYGNYQDILQNLIKNVPYKEEQLLVFKKFSTEKIHAKILDKWFETSSSITEETLKEILTEQEYTTSQFMRANKLSRSKVVSVDSTGSVEVVDLSVPANSTLCYNGFISQSAY